MLVVAWRRLVASWRLVRLVRSSKRDSFEHGKLAGIHGIVFRVGRGERLTAEGLCSWLEGKQ